MPWFGGYWQQQVFPVHATLVPAIPARWLTVRGPNLSIPLPCFGQIWLAVWSWAGIVDGAQVRRSPYKGRHRTNQGPLMQSTLTVHETDPHDIFVIEPDVVLAARPDAARPEAPRADAPRTDNASVDPVHEALSRLAHQRADVQPKFSAVAPSPTLDTTFRAAAADHAKTTGKRSGFGRLVRNTFVGFLFALVSAMAAALWTHHGDAAKQMIAAWLPAKQMIVGWLPPFVLAASSPTEPPPVAEQPSVSPTQAATADQASAPPAQPPDSAAPAQAVAAADSAPLVQSMARDIATMGQQIEQLKASIEQLKASQAQMARDVVKSSELNQRPRIATTVPPRPVAAVPAPVRKPKPVTQVYQPSAYQPSAPAMASTSPPPSSAAPAPLPQPAPSSQAATTAEDGGPLVRPPLPLR